MCFFNAVPQEWRKKLGKSFRKDLPALKFDQNYFYLEIKKEKVDISKVKSRYIYKTLLSKKCYKTNRAVSRYEKLYNTETFKLDWKKFFLIPNKTTLYTKLCEFQFKILNKILYTNDLLYKIGKVKSPLFDFCQSDLETTEHLLFHCHFVKRFWNEMNVLLKAKNILSKPLKIEEVIFEICEDKPNVLLANQIILNGKYYIYYSKQNNSPLSFKSFIQRTKTIYYTESIIAKENKQLVYHKKNGKILSLLYRMFSRRLECELALNQLQIFSQPKRAMSFFFLFLFPLLLFFWEGGGGWRGEFLACLCNFCFCCLSVRFCRCGFSFMFASYLFTNLYFRKFFNIVKKL